MGKLKLYKWHHFCFWSMTWEGPCVMGDCHKKLLNSHWVAKLIAHVFHAWFQKYVLSRSYDRFYLIYRNFSAKGFVSEISILGANCPPKNGQNAFLKGSNFFSIHTPFLVICVLAKHILLKSCHHPYVCCNIFTGSK